MKIGTLRAKGIGAFRNYVDPLLFKTSLLNISLCCIHVISIERAFIGLSYLLSQYGLLKNWHFLRMNKQRPRNSILLYPYRNSHQVFNKKHVEFGYLSFETIPSSDIGIKAPFQFNDDTFKKNMADNITKKTTTICIKICLPLNY